MFRVRELNFIYYMYIVMYEDMLVKHWEGQWGHLANPV